MVARIPLELTINPGYSHLTTRHWTLAILLAFGNASLGCSGRGASNAQAGQPPPAMPVKMVTIQAQPVKQVSEYVATLKSRNSSTITPQVEGQITQIYVKSGEKVAAGSPLMQIDPLKQAASVGSQEAQLQAKRASVRYARQQLERTKKL